MDESRVSLESSGQAPGGYVPEAHFAVGAARSQRPAIGRERDLLDTASMCIKGTAHFLQRGDVPDADGSVVIAHSEEVIARKGHDHRPCGSLEPGMLAAAGHVPETNAPSIKDGQDLAPRHEGHGTDPHPTEESDVSLRGDVPELDA